jgi:hypothetical protein
MRLITTQADFVNSQKPGTWEATLWRHEPARVLWTVSGEQVRRPSIKPTSQPREIRFGARTGPIKRRCSHVGMRSSSSPPMATSTYDWVVGAIAGAHPGSWSGNIDEVAIYDHAPGADRVAAHYSAGAR